MRALPVLLMFIGACSSESLESGSAKETAVSHLQAEASTASADSSLVVTPDEPLGSSTVTCAPTVDRFAAPTTPTSLPSSADASSGNIATAPSSDVIVVNLKSSFSPELANWISAERATRNEGK